MAVRLADYTGPAGIVATAPVLQPSRGWARPNQQLPRQLTFTPPRGPLLCHGTERGK